MKDQLFEPYYKQGFNHFIFKKLMRLKSPTTDIQVFYLGLIAFILGISILM